MNQRGSIAAQRGKFCLDMELFSILSFSVTLLILCSSIIPLLLRLSQGRFNFAMQPRSPPVNRNGITVSLPLNVLELALRCGRGLPGACGNAMI